jgi:dihydroorotase
MPNTDPPLDSAASVASVLERAGGAAARVRVIAAATAGRNGERVSDLADLAAIGIAGVSDDGASVPSEATAREVLTALAALRLPLIEHAETALAVGSVMRAGPATRLGWAGLRPRSLVVERDIALAGTGGWVLHPSLDRRRAGAIRRAKGGGQGDLRLTAPLALTDTGGRLAWLRLGSRGRCRGPSAPARRGAPTTPLSCQSATRLPRGRAGLLAGADGDRRDRHGSCAPPRGEGGGTLPRQAHRPGTISLGSCSRGGSWAGQPAGRALQPAAALIGGRTLRDGAVADTVIFDPAATWRVEASALASASSNTPLLGMELPGVVRMTVAGGRITYRDGLDPTA